MAESIDCLICSICLENFRDPQLLHCLHSFCSKCLEDICKDKDEIDCPICRTPTVVNSWKKDFRLEEFIEHASSLKLHDSFDLKRCSECESDIDSVEIHFCKECAEIFCLDCSLHHKKAKKSKSHTIYSLNPESTPVCAEHNKKLEFFCKESQCYLPICSSCAILNHQGHQICNVGEQATEYLSKFSMIDLINKKKLDEVNKHICRIKDRQAYFDEEIKETESLLKERHDFLLDVVKNKFNEQIGLLALKHDEFTRVFNEEIRKWEAVKAEFKRIEQSISNSLLKKSSHEIIKDYHNFKPVDASLDFNKRFYFEFKMVTITSENHENRVAEEVIEFLIGKVDTIVNNEFLLKDPEQAYLISNMYKCEEELFGVCYDSQFGNLLALTRKASQYVLVRVSENSDVTELEISMKCRDAISHSIALLPNGSVVIFIHFHNAFLKNETSLFFISQKMGECKPISLPFCQVQNIKVMCSSPCKAFVYFYCKDGSIYKYNPDNSTHECASVKLPKEPTFMNVSGNLDYIAFCSSALKKIHVVSFKEEKIIYTIGDNFSMFTFAAFLSENEIVSYDSKLCLIVLINAKKNEIFRKISHFGSSRENIKNVSSIVVRSFNSLFISTFNGGCSEIYKIAV